MDSEIDLRNDELDIKEDLYRRERSRSRSPRRSKREHSRDNRRKSDHWDTRRDSDRRRRDRSRSRRRSDSPPRRRRRTRSRSRSRSRTRSRSRSRDRRGGRGGSGSERMPRSLGGPMNASQEEASEFAKISKKENRVYVGNLSYDVRYGDLIEFMKAAGEVAFAEVLTTPSGVSKGCGIVEYVHYDDAQRAIRELSESVLLGRPIFIREDRENDARFGATPVPGKMGMAIAGMGGYPKPGGSGNPGNQLYVGNLPYQAGWQDLKDLFRTAGNIVRADINIGADGRAKGSGTVIFESTKDAQSAINMYHGYEWYGRTLEVREDRFAGLSGPGSFRGRGGPPGGRGLGRGGSYRGFGRGGYGRVGYGGPAAAAAAAAAAAHGEGRGFSNDIYADYVGPEGNVSGGYANGGYSSSYNGGYAQQQQLEPTQQIMVRNLPWSTANEDLVELFETTGTVELAEILFDGTRSKGSGVVQFSTVDEAETAIAKFSQYVYGGRPLDVRFNDRWHTFTPSAAKGGSVPPLV